MDIVRLSDEFREVFRYEGTAFGKRAESDSEHAYQLAMAAWFLIDQEKLPLNKELCFMYALAHDLVEIYAGDTFIYDMASVESKPEREKEALEKITERFAHFPGLIKAIEGYERKENEESIFIYVLDKLLSPVQIYLKNGELWREKGVDFADLISKKDSKIKLSPDVDKYWQELRGILERNQETLFPKKVTEETL